MATKQLGTAASGDDDAQTKSEVETYACAGNDSRLSDERTPPNDSVTSAKVAAGAIVDSDVNASAAIAISKLGTGAVDGSTNGSAADKTLWTGTAAQYGAIGTKDGNTVYIVLP